MMRLASLPYFFVAVVSACIPSEGQDYLQQLQTTAIDAEQSDVAHWGWKPKTYAQWTTHSNRLVPVYTFGTKDAGRGIDLRSYIGVNSAYRSQRKLLDLYGRLPIGTLDDDAEYMDQTNVFDIQLAALQAGKTHIFLVIFDGMDWQTTRATSIHNLQRVAYEQGRGTGTHFQDYDAGGTSQFGFMATSPHNNGTEYDVDRQTISNAGEGLLGGYDPRRGGRTPWDTPADPRYLIPDDKQPQEGLHPYTDSASAATSMTAGIKTYNNGVNCDPAGRPVRTIAHIAQASGYRVGAVSSVPISHATPAAAYAHNVYRYDHQDLTRDMLGLPSVSHPYRPLPGLDILIGGGHGVLRSKDTKQGRNFVPGNAFITDDDLQQVDVENGGKYVVAMRANGKNGGEMLAAAAKRAGDLRRRLLGMYGIGDAKGHLPYQTADKNYVPAIGKDKTAESYSHADLDENPTLAQMTQAALTVLQTSDKGFWLMVEPGDVDWANHDCNLDNVIGAVNSGDESVKVITDWVEQHSNWDESLLIVTADHGHYMNLVRSELLIEPKSQ